jgi:dienelactone hydrolase
MLAAAPARRRVSAASMLTELGAPGSARASRGVVTRGVVIRSTGASFRGRLYLPEGVVHGCLVVGHGVHWKGIDEPRLIRFATALASRGQGVLTPELSELADYRITRQGADVLSAAVQDLSARCAGQGRGVGLLGFSFAGGLALLAAEDPDVGRHLSYVASVGGYHDLARVLGFLLTDHVETPGGLQPRKAHDYGIVVLLYNHLDAFVPEEDRGVMREAVKAWLEEDRSRAWARASLRTSERSEELFIRLSSGRAGELREALGSLLRSEAPNLAALSPRGALGTIPVPVLLLHGSADSVIPAEETVWANRELGHRPHTALVTPLIEHVEVSGRPKLLEQLALVNFMAQLL